MISMPPSLQNRSGPGSNQLWKQTTGVPLITERDDVSLRFDSAFFCEIQQTYAFGFDPVEPTVLYAPTWGEGSSLDAWGRHLLGVLADRPEQVLVKLHDNSYDARKTSTDWAAALAEIEGPRLKIVRDADVRPALAAADVLVSDASSVANEFLLLDRPIVFADCPGLLDRVAKRADLETWGRKTGRVAADPAGLSAALDAGRSDPDEHAEVRRAAAEDIFHDPGGATERAVEALRRYAGCRG